MPLTPLIHITAAYSNALLVAILPHISDCAKQLDLPIAQPITVAQVMRFNANPLSDIIGGAIWLTNNYSFVFQWGYTESFNSPDDFFTMSDENWDHLERYVGKDNMTTNDAIEFARNSFSKLGYNLADFRVNEQPTMLEGPYDNKRIGHVPFCRIVWKSPEATTREERLNSYSVQFDIDMQRKQVVGMSLSGTNFWRANPTIDIQPELESDYRKRTQSHTNIPVHINTGPPPVIPLKKE